MNTKRINESMSSNLNSIRLINESNWIHQFINESKFSNPNAFNSLQIDSNKRILVQIAAPSRLQENIERKYVEWWEYDELETENKGWLDNFI